MSEPYQLGLVGLGSMGSGMARASLAAGLRVYGDDVDADRVSALRAAGGANQTPDEAAANLDCLTLVVLNAAQTEDVLFGAHGLAGKMRQGAVVMSCATVPPAFAKDMCARCERLGLHYLDAPISGGAAKAAAGALSIMASGSSAAFMAARPVLDAMAETVFELGPTAGAGSAMKAVNQLLAGVHIAAAAEAITLGLTQGVSAAQTVDVISRCAGTSWMFENRGPHIVNGDYTPHSAVDIWKKDLGIVLDIASASGLDTPLTQVALEQFLAASKAGLGREDDAAVIKVYAKQAGIALPEGD